MLMESANAVQANSPERRQFALGSGGWRPAVAQSPPGPDHASMLDRRERDSYQRAIALASWEIGMPRALVAKSIVTRAVMSATEKLSPATWGRS